MLTRLLLAFVLACPLLAGDWYLFTSFRSNGETGIFFALSEDGRKWTPLNGNQPWLKPGEPGMLMRDPWVGQGPDGTWHMLWTWGWSAKDMGGKLKIGYASSKDLVHWSPQRPLFVMENEPAARNLWAPPRPCGMRPARSGSSSGRAPSPAASPTPRAPAIPATTIASTPPPPKTGRRFSPAKLWFDPGFNSIDTTVVQAGGKRWILVFKDERKNPQVKKLRLAFADSPAGPWKDVTEPFTGDWVEGPTVAQIGKEWWVYFDHYTAPRHYGAMRTTDWKSFEDMTPQVSFPADHRHGTVAKIPESLAQKLQREGHTEPRP